MQLFDDVERCVDAVLARVGKRLRLATPLGIGKPNPLVNAFYRRAKSDPTIDLHIFTALSLERPKAKRDLERRFLEPFVERVFGDYPDLEPEVDRARGALPSNVRVIEFYLYAGKYLENAAAQRDYISTNYTHAARDLLDRGVNVLAQAVCRGTHGGEPALSLSSNPDLTGELAAALRRRAAPSAIVGQVNAELPFMLGDAVVPESTFDYLVDAPSQYHQLFGTPKTPVADDELMIGLYASTLVRDGGSLQIGIGSIGDALVYALKLRHEHNAIYREALERIGAMARFGGVIERIGGLGPFEKGLFAPSEMFVDGFMHLIEAGIVRRKVYDDLPLQRLLDEGRIDERVSRVTLEALLEAGAVEPELRERDLRYLQHWGVLRADLRLEDGALVFADGTRCEADLARPASIERVCAHGLGDTLAHGALVHAGFFLGPQVFYRWLRDLPDALREQIQMRGIERVNQLYGHEDLARAQRRDARFVNTAMMVTLFGAIVSDALASGQVVSGVGGQYNFVAMGHALHDARVVMQVRSTRVDSRGKTCSNIVYDYGHTTIARHLRDLVVTDHGIAELRGKTDGEVVEALLAVTDSRFQSGLRARALAASKVARRSIPPGSVPPNDPARYCAVLAELRGRGFFPTYPFGHEFTPEELVLTRVLRSLEQRSRTRGGKLGVLASALRDGSPDPAFRPYLERMALATPGGLREHLDQRLVSAQLRQLGIGG